MGRQDYKTDDGRDAIAAGIAWLLHTHENLERVTNVLAGLSKERVHPKFCVNSK